MNFDVREIGITLVVGAFTLYGAEVLVWFYFRQNLFTRLKDAGAVSETGSVALSLALSFAIGLLMESASTKLVRGSAAQAVSFEHTRRGQLVNSDGLTPLAFEVAGRHLLSSVGGRDVAAIEDSICGSGRIPKNSATLFDSVVARFYYHANNVLMADPQYAHELLGIRQRYDFSIAFFGCTIVLGMLLAALAIVRFFKLALSQQYTENRLWRRWATTSRKADDDVQSPSIGGEASDHATASIENTRDLEGELRQLRSESLRHARRLFVGSVFAAATLLSLGGVTIFAYNYEVGQFTRRVFGYYSSRVAEEELQLVRRSTSIPARVGGTSMDGVITPDTMAIRGDSRCLKRLLGGRP